MSSDDDDDMAYAFRWGIAIGLCFTILILMISMLVWLASL